MLGERASCPCGLPATYDACCGRFHRGASHAETPEQLMRSRYSAYAVEDASYVWRTWHPKTRPDDVNLDEAMTWVGLEIHGSGESDPDNWVEFTASYVTPTGLGQLHERSRFDRRAGRWLYVDGDVT